MIVACSGLKVKVVGYDADDMTILMCAQNLTDDSLIYRTGPKTKTSKMKKTKKQTYMLRRNGAGQETMESVRKREGSLGWK